MCSVCLRKLLASNSFRKQCQASEYRLIKLKREFAERRLIIEIEAKFDAAEESVRAEAFDEDAIEYIEEPDEESSAQDEENNAECAESDDLPSTNFELSDPDQMVFDIEVLNEEKPAEDAEIDECDSETSDRTQASAASKRKKCPICGKWVVNLKPHLAIHEDADKRRKPYKCQYCGKAFLQRAQFDAHVNKEHTGEKPFSCDECGKSFHGRPTLRMHKIQHSSKRRFVCEYCNKSYRYAHHLSHHRYTHTQRRIFHCKLCDYRNVHPDNLKRHINKKHPQLKSESITTETNQ